MHHRRTWCVATVDSAEVLSEKLTSHTWTLCTGFLVRGHEEYLFLNDSTSEDALMEFAIIHGHRTAEVHEQIETITFSWCDLEAALWHIRATLVGEYDRSDFAHRVSLRGQLDSPEEHRHCPLCA